MNTAMCNGREFWSGCVSLLDGFIEETHTYEEAEQADFHHTLYFSDGCIERMDNGESVFFFVDENGRLQGEWRNSVDESIRMQIMKQILILHS